MKKRADYSAKDLFINKEVSEYKNIKSYTQGYISPEHNSFTIFSDLNHSPKVIFVHKEHCHYDEQSLYISYYELSYTE